MSFLGRMALVVFAFAGSAAAQTTPVVNAHLTIPAHELAWRFSATGGPGGQHANTSNTRATVTFDIQASESLTDWQRERLLDRIGGEISVTAGDERSQLRNRNLALDRLRERLVEALRTQIVRRPTRPSKGSQQRRLNAKAQRSTTKANRRLGHRHDD